MADLEKEQSGRISELDYLKCVMIVLVISFHLVYIGDTYPHAKQLVYTFHMPVFLLLSGFLMNFGKPVSEFMRTMLWFVVPYVVMESGYTLMASLLPIREHIEHLTFSVFLDKLLLHPLGPYWYLHTLVLCGTIWYVVSRLPRLSVLSDAILSAVVYALLAYVGVVSLSMSLYFLAGILLRCSGLKFLNVFRPSWLAVLPLTMLALNPSNLHSGTAGGMLIVYLVVSLLLALWAVMPITLRRPMLFIGRNTLPLFLFSPIFTILCKPLVPLLAFDPTALLFLVLSLTICIIGSLAIVWLMDIMGLSRFFFQHTSLGIKFYS